MEDSARTLAIYDDASRRRIEDGDVILCRGNYLLSKLFELFNRSNYSHAALAVWWGDRLMILQAVATGIQAIPMSEEVRKYSGRVDWYKLNKDSFSPLTPSQCDQRLPRVIADAKEDLGKAYGYMGLLRNVWGWIVKVKLRDPVRPKAMFCSQYVEHCFSTGGLSLTGKPAITTLPKDLEGSPHLSYLKTLERDPKLTPTRGRLPKWHTP